MTRLLTTCLLLLVAIMLSKAQSVQQYCDINPQHTMCITTGVHARCGTDVIRGVSDADKVAIVAKHNELRNKVATGGEAAGAPGPQPKAADMLEMVYDDELATIAQRLTDQCVYAHDCVGCSNVARFQVGQNLLGGPIQSYPWQAAVAYWYSEVAAFSKDGVAEFVFSPSTGHYTQVVWAKTKYVGCGSTAYKKDGVYNLIMACNYGPAGNMGGGAVYKEGEPCSACPAGTSKSNSYSGLCA